MANEHRFHVRSGDDDLVARVTPAAGAALVQVQGVRYRVTARGDGAQIVQELDGHRQWTVHLDPGALPTQVSVAGVAAPIETRTAQQAALQAALQAAGGGAGGGRVEAPMPGRIVRILVEAGQEVVQGQPVVIIEAMKMENELAAARDGTVSKIHVAEGDAVEIGALLCELAET